MTYLDLHMPIDPEGSVAATAPLAWCVTRKLTEILEQRKFTSPHLLVIVRARKNSFVGDVSYNEWYDRRAFVVPLQNALVYTSFNTDGAHEIHAFVVNIEGKRSAKHMKEYMGEIVNRGAAGLPSIISDSGVLYSKTDSSEYVPNWQRRPELTVSSVSRQSETIEVHVPADMFAPPPAEWKQRTVKKFFKSSNAADQCHFRKRFWFVSLPLAVVVAPVYFIAKVLLLTVGTLAGVRGFAWRVLKHPLAPITDVYSTSSTWYAPLQNSDHEDKFSIWTILNFPVLSFISIMVCAIVSAKASTVASVFISIAVMLIILYVLDKCRLVGSYSAYIVSRNARNTEKNRLETIVALEGMLCETNLPANSIRDLPREKQTVSLRFYDFKTKVCKPFAR